MRIIKSLPLIFKISLLVLISFFLFWNPNQASAINTCSTGFQVSPGQTKEVDCHGICWKVNNQSGYPSTFIPTNIQQEWQDFIGHKPGHISLEDCVTFTIRLSACCPLSGNLSGTYPNYSGEAPLDGVDMVIEAFMNGGTAEGGTYRYRIDCTNNGTWEKDQSVYYAVFHETYQATNLCDYSTAGTYNVKARVDHEGEAAYDQITIDVSAPSCSDQCSYSGQHDCSGTSGRTCGDYDGDPCLEWSGWTSCDSNCYSCGDGTCDSACGEDSSNCSADCGPSCSDECSYSGQDDCCGSWGNKTCGDYDGDPCLEWSGCSSCGSDTCIGTTWRDYYCTGSGNCTHSDTSCSSNCYSCGDGTCDSACGEDSSNCSADCGPACHDWDGDGYTAGGAGCDGDCCDNDADVYPGAPGPSSSDCGCGSWNSPYKDSNNCGDFDYNCDGQETKVCTNEDGNMGDLCVPIVGCGGPGWCRNQTPSCGGCSSCWINCCVGALIPQCLRCCVWNPNRSPCQLCY